MPRGASVDDSLRRAAFENFLRALRTPLATSTPTDREKERRAEAIVGRMLGGAGQPARVNGGASIPIPLPFGGPSAKQRERDRAINAETMQILARTWKRADSVRALRERRHADSLAQSRDTMQRDSNR